MIVGNFGSSPEELWAWFRLPDSDGEVELRLMNRMELKVLSENTDLAAEARLIAKSYFRDFRNLKDRHGADIPNTEENRAIIMTTLEIGPFVTRKLISGSGWFAEGKGGSGSAS